jgi:hypothetical protein
MDKKMKKTGLSIGILDLLILTLLAAGIFFALQLSVPAAGAAGVQDNITFVVEMTKKEEAFVNSVKAGEKLYENLKGIYLGQVVEVKVEPYKAISPDLDTATYKQAAVSGLYNVYLTVKASAVSSGGSIMVNGYEVAVGKEMFVRTRSVASPGYCVKMDMGGI